MSLFNDIISSFIVHMYTYQQEFICHYSRLSSVLDMDSVISQQSLREVQFFGFLLCNWTWKFVLKSMSYKKTLKLFLMALKNYKMTNTKLK